MYIKTICFIVGRDFMPKTTIAVDTDVAEALNKLGQRGETYNDILKRVLKLPLKKT
jgi:hypothetical protein